jgi:hypothetical protein
MKLGMYLDKVHPVVNVFKSIYKGTSVLCQTLATSTKCSKHEIHKTQIYKHHAATTPHTTIGTGRNLRERPRLWDRPRDVQV